METWDSGLRICQNSVKMSSKNNWFRQSFSKNVQSCMKNCKLFANDSMQNVGKYVFGAVQKCVYLQISSRAFQRVFTCKIWRWYSRERALNNFKFHSHPGNLISYPDHIVSDHRAWDAVRHDPKLGSPKPREVPTGYKQRPADFRQTGRSRILLRRRNVKPPSHASMLIRNQVEGLDWLCTWLLIWFAENVIGHAASRLQLAF